MDTRVLGVTRWAALLLPTCSALALGCSNDDAGSIASGGASNLGAASGAAGALGPSTAGRAGAAATGTVVSGAPGEAGAGGTGASAAGADGTSPAPDASGADGGVAQLSDVLPRELYAAMFPNRNALYDYDALITAAASYPEFGTEGSLEQRRREVAGFFGNAAHETTGGWAAAPGGPEAWGLYFTQEVGCEDGSCTQYCDASNVRYPCAPGKTYHGRGPIQLSWNFNYGAFGEVLGLELLENPDLVTSDGVIAFSTALWFWMTPQAPKPSAHAALLGSWQPTATDTAAGRQPGFGMTVNIINGGRECGMPTNDRTRDRIRFFQHFVEMLGTTEGEHLECADMQSY